MIEFRAGDSFEVVFPMVRDTVELLGEDGPYTTNTWKPGVRFEQTDCFGGTSEFADAEGLMVLTVVSTHKPGKYPERVFYIRQFISPQGTRFGKSNLRMSTARAFSRMTRGYRYEYEIAP